MGGLGSGTYWRHSRKTSVEELKGLDIRHMKRVGCLRPNYFGGWHWSVNGERVGDIKFRTGHNEVTLMFRSRVNEGDWESIEQRVEIEHTDCHMGGKRPWFLCPACNKRVALLYAGGKYFACRHCYDLTYSCQKELSFERMRRKAKKIRQQLQATEEPLQAISTKPKHMHYRTFERLRERALDLEWKAEMILDDMLNKYESLLRT